MKTIKFLSLASLLFGMGHQASAALIWQADFESYSTISGPVALIVNPSGDNNTFTNTSISRIDSPLFQVADTSVPAFMSGNALHVQGTTDSASGTSSFYLYQNALPVIGDTGVMVLSYDLLRSTGSTLGTLNARLVNEAGGTTSSETVSLSQATPYRITLVVNRTGGEITLPGALGLLSTGYFALYRYDGTTFTLTASSLVTASNNASGFQTGPSQSNPAAGLSVDYWFDNFGVWDSLSDTVDGVGVLELAPGVVPVPESAITPLLILGLGGILALRRGKKLL